MKERPNRLSEAQAALNVLLICMIASSCTPESNEQVVLEPTQTKTLEVLPTETTIPPTPTVKAEEETQGIDTGSVKSSQSEWLSAFVANNELSEMEDMMVEYQRTGKIYFDDLKNISEDNMEDYLLAFRELIDEDLYMLGYDEKGWFIDVNAYPLDKTDNIEDVFRYYSGRSGDLVITDGEGEVLYTIAGLTFYSPKPTPKPGTGSGGDSCPADRQKPDGGCCPIGFYWSDFAGGCTKEGNE